MLEPGRHLLEHGFPADGADLDRERAVLEHGAGDDPVAGGHDDGLGLAGEQGHPDLPAAFDHESVGGQLAFTFFNPRPPYIQWSAVTNVGTRIHVDNHAFASHPTNCRQIYAGTDGGIYRSADGGCTWDDSINEGPVITQFEFISQHPDLLHGLVLGTVCLGQLLGKG